MKYGRVARSKYRAQPTTVDGIRFASQREAQRYSALKMLQRCGAIRDLELQPEYPIDVAGQRICRYLADFRYVDLVTGEVVTEDVKGMKTPAYRLKKKLVEALYPVQIRET